MVRTALAALDRVKPAADLDPARSVGKFETAFTVALETIGL